MELRRGQERDFIGQEMRAQREQEEQRAQDPDGRLKAGAFARRHELFGTETGRTHGATRLPAEAPEQATQEEPDHRRDADGDSGDMTSSLPNEEAGQARRLPGLFEGACLLGEA